jgi:hypothetical protein
VADAVLGDGYIPEAGVPGADGATSEKSHRTECLTQLRHDGFCSSHY